MDEFNGFVHPEMQEGEKYMGNMYERRFAEYLLRWQAEGKTARMGIEAYDMYRKPITSAPVRPVFLRDSSMNL